MNGCVASTEGGAVEDTSQEAEVQQLWQQDATALKEEADKRRAKREQEAEARKARIEAAQQAADEAMGETAGLNTAAAEAKPAASPRQEARKAEAKKEEVKVSAKSKAKKEEAKKEEAKGDDTKAADAKKAPETQAETKTDTTKEEPAKDEPQPAAKKEDLKSSAKSKAKKEDAKDEGNDKSEPKTAAPAPVMGEKEAALQKQVDEAIAITKDPDLVKYNLDIKICGARELAPTDADPYAMCSTKGKIALRFRTKTSSQRASPVWNQAGKVQVMHGDSLSFCIYDKENPGPTDHLAKAELVFDQVIPSGFEGEIALEDKDGAVSEKTFIKVRVRVSSAVAAE